MEIGLDSLVVLFHLQSLWLIVVSVCVTNFQNNVESAAWIGLIHLSAMPLAVSHGRDAAPPPPEGNVLAIQRLISITPPMTHTPQDTHE